MRSDAQPLLIAALSGRMLAASAQRAGRDTMVLDLFNDLDTRRYALLSRAVTDGAGGFGAAALLQGVNEFYDTCAGIVIGSGFEDKPELLRELTSGRVLYGNSPEVVTKMKDPEHFFPLLDFVDIPHPDVSLMPPTQASGWLLKHVGASGGAHIQWMRDATGAYNKVYYQRHVRGRNMSVLFVADGKRAQILGVSEQWTVAMSPRYPFCYGGAVGHAPLPAGVLVKIETGLNRLVAASGLVGLNGMDFILDDHEYWVLEVNPRPTATMDLYDDDWPHGLLAIHLQACYGELPLPLPGNKTIRAHAIVYAPQPLVVSDHFEFPQWCSDIPEAGAAISQHAPICTVRACGDSIAVVKLKLKERQALITYATRELAA